MSHAPPYLPLTSLPLDSPAKISVWPESEQDWKALEAACSGKSSGYSAKFNLYGSFSKTYRAFSLPKTGKISLLRSTPWMNSGMVWRGVCLTRSSLESPRDAGVCSLSDVLESHVPKRFFLSPRAAQGILRRAEKQGRVLPSRLQQALEVLAMATETHGTQPTSQSPTPSAQPTTTPATRPDRDERTTSTLPLSKMFAEERGTERTAGKKSESEKADQVTPSALPSSTPLPSRCQANIAGSDTDTTPTTSLSVRRLTPTECETLQAFPKGWTVPATEHWGMRSRRR